MQLTLWAHIHIIAQKNQLVYYTWGRDKEMILTIQLGLLTTSYKRGCLLKTVLYFICSLQNNQGVIIRMQYANILA